MSRKIDLTDKIFERLTVKYEDGKKGNLTAWFCECTCGCSIRATTSGLQSGHYKSCGCLKKEKTKTNLKDRNTTHGLRHKNKEYKAWWGMVQKCHNPKNVEYSKFGAFGFKVSEKWKEDFASFLSDIGDAPSKTSRLIRIDDQKDFEPGNVKWKEKAIVSMGEEAFKEFKRKEALDIQSRYRERNPEKVKEGSRKSYWENREERLAYNKQYYKENWENIKPKKNKRYNKRRKEDIYFRLSESLRKRLLRAIKAESKSGSAVRDLGCTIEFLKGYLEAKFQEGMSWDNWGIGVGKWHIDHILPLDYFDLTDREQFLKACHYTNLQPLWSEENIRKGGRVGDL